MKHGTTALLGMACLVLIAIGIGGCAESGLVASTAKLATDNQNQIPPYKLGKPYQIEGAWYYPKVDYEYNETGIASWYGAEFHGKATANGEIFDQNGLTAAHKTLPMPTVVRVTNLENGRSIEVRVNDRGPFVNDRIIDLTRRGALLLGFEGAGTARDRVQVMKEDSIIMANKVGGAQLAYAGQPEPQAAAPKPLAAPAGPVTIQTLPVNGQAPSAPLPQASSGSVLSNSGATNAPAATALPPLSSNVTYQPIKPTNIFIQAGAFLQRGNAQNLSDKLRGLGATRITQVQLGQQVFYRVRLGPIQRVEDADSMLQKVLHAGQPDARIVVE